MGKAQNICFFSQKMKEKTSSSSLATTNTSNETSLNLSNWSWWTTLQESTGRQIDKGKDSQASKHSIHPNSRYKQKKVLNNWSMKQRKFQRKCHRKYRNSWN